MEAMDQEQLKKLEQIKRLANDRWKTPHETMLKLSEGELSIDEVVALFMHQPVAQTELTSEDQAAQGRLRQLLVMELQQHPTVIMEDPKLRHLHVSRGHAGGGDSTWANLGMWG